MDWRWWQDNTVGDSDAKLRQEIAECKAEIHAIRGNGHQQRLAEASRRAAPAPGKEKPKP
jgi:hypothetical protein